jgi:hypothetical protein
MKGICFIEPLFHAAVNGTKTQTRRIVKPQPEFISNDNNMPRNCHLEFIKPKYQVGEKVYLKEPYFVSNLMSGMIKSLKSSSKTRLRMRLQMCLSVRSTYAVISE